MCQIHIVRPFPDSWCVGRKHVLRVFGEAKVKQLLTKSGTVCGVTYEKKGKDFTEEGLKGRGGGLASASGRETHMLRFSFW